MCPCIVFRPAAAGANELGVFGLGLSVDLAAGLIESRGVGHLIGFGPRPLDDVVEEGG